MRCLADFPSPDPRFARIVLSRFAGEVRWASGFLHLCWAATPTRPPSSFGGRPPRPSSRYALRRGRRGGGERGAVATRFAKLRYGCADPTGAARHLPVLRGGSFLFRAAAEGFGDAGAAGALHAFAADLLVFGASLRSFAVVGFGAVADG